MEGLGRGRDVDRTVREPGRLGRALYAVKSSVAAERIFRRGAHRVVRVDRKDRVSVLEEHLCQYSRPGTDIRDNGIGFHRKFISKKFQDPGRISGAIFYLIFD